MGKQEALTRLIAEAFNEHGIKYHISEPGDNSTVEAWLEVTSDPGVPVRFISTDNGNDVAIRVYSLICKVPAGKKKRRLYLFDDKND